MSYSPLSVRDNFTKWTPVIAVYYRGPIAISSISVRINSSNVITLSDGTTSVTTTYVGRSLKDVVASLNAATNVFDVVSLIDITAENMIANALICDEYNTDKSADGAFLIRYTGHIARYLERNVLQLKGPTAKTAFEPWYARIGNGTIRTRFSDISFTSYPGINPDAVYTFGIDEFINQDWSVIYGKPYKDVFGELPSRIDYSSTFNGSVLSLSKTPILYKNNISILIKGVRQSNSIIRHVDVNNGLVYLNTKIDRNIPVTVDYTYKEEDYVYDAIDLNASLAHSPLLVDSYVAFYLKPIASNGAMISGGKSIFHEILNTEVGGKHKIAQPIPSTLNSANVLYEPVIYLGSISVRQVYDKDSIEVIDTRSRGGGVKQDSGEDWKEIKYYYDIGSLDGDCIPGNAALVINVPHSVTQRGMPIEEIKYRGTKDVALGVATIVSLDAPGIVSMPIQPYIWGISPNGFMQTNNAKTIAIYGKNLSSDSEVYIENVLSYSYYNGDNLVTTIPSVLANTVGNIEIKVVNPGGLSDTYIITVNQYYDIGYTFEQNSTTNYWTLSSFTGAFSLSLPYIGIFTSVIYDTVGSSNQEYEQSSFSVVATEFANEAGFSLTATFSADNNLSIYLRADKTESGLKFSGPVVTNTSSRYVCQSVRWPIINIPPLGDNLNNDFVVNPYVFGHVKARPGNSYTILNSIDNPGFISLYNSINKKIVTVRHDDENQNNLFLAGRGSNGRDFKIVVEHVCDKHYLPGVSWSKSYNVYLETFYGLSDDARTLYTDACLRYRQWAADPTRPWRRRGLWESSDNFSPVVKDSELHLTYATEIHEEIHALTGVIPRWLSHVGDFSQPLLTIYGWKNWQQIDVGTPDYAYGTGGTNHYALDYIPPLRADGWNPIYYQYLAAWDGSHPRAGFRIDDYQYAYDSTIPTNLTGYCISTTTGIFTLSETYPEMLQLNALVAGPFNWHYVQPDFSYPIWENVYKDFSYKMMTGMSSGRPVGVYMDALNTLNAYPLLTTLASDMEADNDPSHQDFSQSSFYKGRVKAVNSFKEGIKLFETGALSLTEWASQPLVGSVDLMAEKPEFPSKGINIPIFPSLHGDMVRTTNYNTQIDSLTNSAGLTYSYRFTNRVVQTWLYGGIVTLNDGTADDGSGDPLVIHETYENSPHYYFLKICNELRGMTDICKPYFAGHVTRTKIPDWRAEAIEENPFASERTQGFSYNGIRVDYVKGIATDGSHLAGLVNSERIIDATGGLFSSDLKGSILIKSGATYAVIPPAGIPTGVYVYSSGSIGDMPAANFYWEPAIFGGKWTRGIIGIVNMQTDLDALNGTTPLYSGDIFIDYTGGLFNNSRANSLVELYDYGNSFPNIYRDSSFPADNLSLVTLNASYPHAFDFSLGNELRYNNYLDKWVVASYSSTWNDIKPHKFTIMSETWRRNDGSLGIIVVNTWIPSSWWLAADTAYLTAVEAAYPEYFNSMDKTISLDTNNDLLPKGNKDIYLTKNGGPRTYIDTFDSVWSGTFTFDPGDVALIEVVGRD